MTSRSDAWWTYKASLSYHYHHAVKNNKIRNSKKKKEKSIFHLDDISWRSDD